jgi:Ca2+-binding RTX toxin-like protein
MLRGLFDAYARVHPGGEGDTVRRLVFLVGVAAMVLVAGGTALAATLACNGGRCVGGDGADTMFGSGGRDEIYSLGGRDLVRAYAGGDFVNGDGGDDRLTGGRGDDTVNGSDGEDLVAGNPGNDRLNGGTGSDRIEAVDGMRDQISCGNGPRDVAVFDSGLDRLAGCEIRQPR